MQVQPGSRRSPPSEDVRIAGRRRGLAPTCRLVLLACLLTGFWHLPAAAADDGYWVCVSGGWVAHGAPSYPAPTKQCGSEIAIPVTRPECMSAGGRWAPIGIFPAPVCTMPTRDGGHVCGDTEECEGLCIAALSDVARDQAMRGASFRTLGRCAVHVPTLGCLAIVRKGAVSGLTCFD